MDVRCPKCGEPWDIDSIHDELALRHSAYKPWMVEKKPNPHSYMDKFTGLYHDQTIYEKYFNGIYAEFRVVGCNLFNVKHSDTKAHPGIAALMDMMGDDIDGAATSLEDFAHIIDE